MTSLPRKRSSAPFLGTPADRSAVVVLASTRTGHPIARSLGRLGVDVFGVYPARHEVVASRYWRDIHILDVESRPTDETAARLVRLGQSIGGRPQLMATSDDHARFVAAHGDLLAEGFEFRSNPEELVTTLTDKQRLHQLCVELGFPVPPAHFPANREELGGLMPRLRFPVLLKGIDTRAVERRTGRAMALAENPAQLRDLYDAMEVDGRPTLLVQEQMLGGADTRWMFNGYFDRSSQPQFGLTSVKVRENPILGGSASLAESRWNPRLVKEAGEFLEAIRYQGPVDMDYGYDRETDEYRLLDVNPRIGAAFRAFVDDRGWDVARVTHADLDGIPVVTGRPRDGRRWLFESSDLAASVRYSRAGQLGLRSWLRSLGDVEELAWFSRDDLRPLLSMGRIMATKVLSRRPTGSDRLPPRAERVPSMVEAE